MKYWWPTLAWAALIFYFSSWPTIRTSDIYWQDFILKKTAHLVEYFVLALLLHRSLKETTNLTLPQLLILTLTLVLVYAVSDEIHQSFIPGREARGRDVVIDGLGATFALLFAHRPSHNGHNVLSRSAPVSPPREQ